jgi:hypothetical protein
MCERKLHHTASVLPRLMTACPVEQYVSLCLNAMTATRHTRHDVAAPQLVLLLLLSAAAAALLLHGSGSPILKHQIHMLSYCSSGCRTVRRPAIGCSSLSTQHCTVICRQRCTPYLFRGYPHLNCHGRHSSKQSMQLRMASCWMVASHWLLNQLGNAARHSLYTLGSLTAATSLKHHQGC